MAKRARFEKEKWLEHLKQLRVSGKTIRDYYGYATLPIAESGMMPQRDTLELIELLCSDAVSSGALKLPPGYVLSDFMLELRTEYFGASEGYFLNVTNKKKLKFVKSVADSSAWYGQQAWGVYVKTPMKSTLKMFENITELFNRSLA